MAAPAIPQPSHARFNRPWVKYTLVGIVAFAVGAAAAGGGADKSASPAKVRTVTKTDTVTKTVHVAPSKAARAREHHKLLAERAKVAGAKDKLDGLEGDIAAQKSKLQQLTGAVSAAKANTFAGTGTYLVGADINPGVYRAAPSPGCYWARLSTLNTSDIIDNDNADGPVVVEIGSSDKAFQASDCAKFHKIG
jgi:hypothetical protein